MNSPPVPESPQPVPGPTVRADEPVRGAAENTPTPVETSPSLSLHPGFRPLPEYELVQRLGSGGFGEVWKANGPGGFPVALKFIHLEGDAGEAEVRALEVMKEIRHPQLLHLVGAWRRDGYLIVAMELGDRTLHQRLQEVRRQGLAGIPRPELLEYMRDAARGIDYLNSINIRHRDIKPQNFLLVGGGLKVADFGLAKLAQNLLTSNSGAMTPAFAAPEFLKDQTSDRSDQYSLAISYCQLRGGRLPFVGNQANVMLGHLHDTPDLTMIPEAERPLVLRALAKKPEDRWPSCKEFIEAVAAVPEQDVPFTRPAPEAPRDALTPTRIAATVATVAWPAGGRGPGPYLASFFGVMLLFPIVAWLWPQAPEAAPASLPAEAESVAVLPADVPSAITNSLGMKLVLLPAGTFTMGANADNGALRDDDGPAHTVRITQPFYLGPFEVTQRQYFQVMDTNPSHYNAESGGGPNHPVENVTWEEATLFCRRLSDLPSERGRTYRLPTEAEWEFACRTGAKPSASSGEAVHNLGDRAWFAANSTGQTKAVGGLKANSWGLYDLQGNVWEWCADWSAPYDAEGGPQIDPHGPRRGYGRVLRGGAWSSYPWACRPSSRSCLPPACKSDDVGFRVAMTPSPAPERPSATASSDGALSRLRIQSPGLASRQDGSMTTGGKEHSS